MTGQHPIVIQQGATFRLQATWKDAAGNPVNLTGYTARMQVRRDHYAPAKLLDLTTTGTNPAITLGGTTGVVTIAVPASDTAALQPGSAVYDLELVDGAGVVTRLLEGQAYISPEVTR